MEEPALLLVSHQRELVRQWEVAQVEELFEARVRPGFGQPGVALRDLVKKKQPVPVAAACWLMMEVGLRPKRLKRSPSMWMTVWFVREEVVAAAMAVVVGQQEAAFLVREGEGAVVVQSVVLRVWRSRSALRSWS